MSNRKVFQAAPRPKASQANTLDTNLKKIDANEAKRARRKGLRETEKGASDEVVEKGKNEKKVSLDAEESKSEQRLELPVLSPKSESNAPNNKQRIKKVG